MHKQNTDSLGVFRVERDIYNVQTLPYERHRKVIPLEFIVPEREDLEREFFARLQGDSGSLGPMIGKVARLIVWCLIFPFYAIYYVISTITQYIKKKKED